MRRTNDSSPRAISSSSHGSLMLRCRRMERRGSHRDVSQACPSTSRPQTEAFRPNDRTGFWLPSYLLTRRHVMKKIGREAALFTVLGLVIFGPALVAGQTKVAPPQAVGGLPDLVGALKATPGVIGVETARTSTGKNVIFAWFENKKAVLAWYYSDTHRSLQKMFAPGSPARTPMADIPDDDSPVLA